MDTWKGVWLKLAVAKHCGSFARSSSSYQPVNFIASTRQRKLYFIFPLLNRALPARIAGLVVLECWKRFCFSNKLSLRPIWKGRTVQAEGYNTYIHACIRREGYITSMYCIQMIQAQICGNEQCDWWSSLPCGLPFFRCALSIVSVWGRCSWRCVVWIYFYHYCQLPSCVYVLAKVLYLGTYLGSVMIEIRSFCY